MAFYEQEEAPYCVPGPCDSGRKFFALPIFLVELTRPSRQQ